MGQKRPNDLGLADMLGNAWNVVNDPEYTYPRQQGTEVTLDREFLDDVRDDVNRLMRGGSLDSNPLTLRSPARGYNRPTTRGLYSGFRVARTTPP